MRKPRVLVVDDMADIREQRAEILAHEGYEVEVADGVQSALRCFRKSPFPVVVTDLRMEGSEDGLEIARRIRQISPETKVIIVTATERQRAAVDGYRVNVFEYVEKARGTRIDSLRAALVRAFDEIREQKVKKSMFAFLTHTMCNTFAGAEPALNEALGKSGSLAAKLDGDRDVYQMISNLAFLKTSLATVDSMLRAYKLLIREPENLRRAWEADRGGDSAFGDLLNAAVGAGINRLFCQESQIPTLKRLASSFGIADRKMLKKQFVAETLLVAEEDRISAIDWLSRHFPMLTVEGEPPTVAMSRSGLRYGLIFAVLSELCFNAIKYSDGRTPIRVTWKTGKENLELTLTNTYDRESTMRVGSKEGRNFIATLLAPLDGIAVDSVDAGEHEGLFETRLVISEQLLTGESNQ